MKKLTLILLFLTCLTSVQASAQWYIFPGRNKQKEKQEKQGKKENPVNKEQQVDSSTAIINLGSVPDPVQADSVASPILEKADDFILDIPQTIHVTLLLPLRSTYNPSSNFYEYYTGVMLAAADLGKKGYNIDLKVYDTSDKGNVVPENTIRESDIIIGPISKYEIQTLLPKCAEGQSIISPLEPKVLELVDSCNVIQLPVLWERQTDEMVKWLTEEKDLTDAIFVLMEDKPGPAGDQAKYLLNKLDEAGTEYTIIRSSTVSDLQLARRNAFLVASDDEKFICTAVNNISSLTNENEFITLYGPSKFRSLDGIHSESLYKTNARLISNYFVDYSNPSVKNFILKFRAVFNAEPSSFAFHGYDTMLYFTTLVNTYGRQWRKRITHYQSSGLQTDFKFEADGRKGAENCAVRRIRYYSDLSTSLQ